MYYFDWQVRVGSRSDAADGRGERPHLRAARTRRRDSEERRAQRRQVRYVTRRRQRRVGRSVITGILVMLNKLKFYYRLLFVLFCNKMYNYDYVEICLVITGPVKFLPGQ